MEQNAKQALDEWIVDIKKAQPGIPVPLVSQVGISIVRRARKLADDNGLKTAFVTVFLLRVTRRWAEEGQKLDTFMARMPENVQQLGIMKQAEEPKDVKLHMGRPN